MTTHFRKLLTALILFAACTARGQVIVTYAGTAGTGGYYGDLSLAIWAQLSSPSDVVVDSIGNLYIADFINNAVRKVDTAGIISTIAGTGLGAGGTATGGYSGDNGPATAANLNGPFAIALDKHNNVIFADGYNHVVRKIAADGIITTIAGNNTAGYSGDGGAATAAALNNPVGLAIDTADNIYIADDHNNVIRMVTPAGIISTFAGDSTAGYAGDDGPATIALLNNPLGVAADKSGNVFITDANNMVRRVDAAGIIHAYVGSTDTAHGYSGDGGPALSAKLYNPAHMAFDNDNNLYIADVLNSVIRKVTPAGIISTYAGTGTAAYSGDGGAAESAELGYPYAIAFNSLGHAFIADRGNEVIRRIGPPLTDAVANTNSIKQGLSVYPNPSDKGIFTVNISSNIAEQAMVNISNVLGQSLAKYSINTNRPSNINAGLLPGVYFISATTPHGSWNVQLVVR